LKKILTKFANPTYPLIIYDTANDENNNLWIPGDSGTVYSEAFSSNGENLYATKANYIERYDISSVMQLYKPNAEIYRIKANNAYNLKMVTNNGIDELFVSTDRGVEVYDVLNNGDLNYISEYTTEGAQTGYQPKMEYISDKNMLLFTDGYKGLKVLKFDASYKPMLCGVGYFSPYSDFTKLAKVTSIASYFNYTDNNYYIIVGVEGYGLIQLKLDDLLFKHCK
jgi:WD40 repeat protein